MINRIWIMRVAIEITALLLLAALWPANASTAPKWECTSAGDWSMAIYGLRTPIIISDVAPVLDFNAPDKMRVFEC